MKKTFITVVGNMASDSVNFSPIGVTKIGEDEFKLFVMGEHRGNPFRTSGHYNAVELADKLESDFNLFNTNFASVDPSKIVDDEIKDEVSST